MRSFATLSLFAILSVATSSFAAPHVNAARDGQTEIAAAKIDAFVVADIVADVVGGLAPSPVKRRTNAERFARGLQPAAPRRRHGNVLARDPAPSAGPTVSRRGKVAVTDTDGNPLGYIGGTSYKKGIYQIVKSTGDVAGASDALTITFELGLTATAGEQLEFSVSNTDIVDLPALALIQGGDSADSILKVGSASYVTFGASVSATIGSIPTLLKTSFDIFVGLFTARTAESFVWSLDIATKIITPSWINPDGTAASLVLFIQESSEGTFLYAGGDKDAFSTKYPGGVVTEIHLAYVGY